MTIENNNVPDNELISDKLRDAMTPGYQAEFSPSEADMAGAFKEDALGEDDALDSCIELPVEFQG